MAEEKDKKKKAPAAKASSAKTTRAKEEPSEPVEAVTPRMWTMYKDKVIPKLKDEFKFKSSMQVPRLKKIVLNAGLGRATANIKIIDQAIKDITSITGQKPVATKSKVAISNFKLRAGLQIGVMVTLRG